MAKPTEFPPSTAWMKGGAPTTSPITDDTHEALERVRKLANTFLNAHLMEIEGAEEAEPHPSLYLGDSGRLGIPQVLGSNVYFLQRQHLVEFTEMVKTLGQKMNEALNYVMKCMEDQMVLVFRHLNESKAKVEKEAALVRKHRWEDELPPKPPAQTRASPIPRGASSSKVNQSTEGPTKTVMNGYCHFLIESVVATAGAERGYVYLHKELSNTLHCVANNPASLDCADLPISSTCVPSTVFQSGVAINTSYPETASSIHSRRPRHVLAMPIPGQLASPNLHPGAGVTRGRQIAGVLVLHNKRHATGFTTKDESLASHAALLVASFLERYPAPMRLEMPVVNGLLNITSKHCPGSQLKALALVEDMFKSREGTKKEGSMATLQDEEQLILRMPYKEKGLAREVAGGNKVPVGCEADLKECAGYISNLEHMWKKCLHENSTLQSEKITLEARMREKDSQILSLEITVKDIAKQYTKVRNDVLRLQGTLPACPPAETPFKKEQALESLEPTPPRRRRSRQRASEGPTTLPAITSAQHSSGAKGGDTVAEKVTLDDVLRTRSRSPAAKGVPVDLMDYATGTELRNTARFLHVR